MNTITSLHRRGGPAIKALSAQLVAFCVVGLAVAVLASQAGLVLPLMAVLLCQGVIAAGVSHRFSQARWWLPIHFLFPVFVAATHRLELPAWIFLCGFLSFLALYWTTFRSQVPYYPSGPRVWDAVTSKLPADARSFIDVGSGMGGLVMHVAAYRRGIRSVGIESAPLPWLVSWFHAAWTGNPAIFRWGHYETLDLGDFDVVFAYLSPAAMPRLWEKARREMRPGSTLMSYEFPVSGVPPTDVVQPEGRRSPLYCWTM